MLPNHPETSGYVKKGLTGTNTLAYFVAASVTKKNDLCDSRFLELGGDEHRGQLRRRRSSRQLLQKAPRRLEHVSGRITGDCNAGNTN